MLGDETDAADFARKVVDRSGASRFLLDAWSVPVWLLRRAGDLDRIGDLLPELRRFDMPRPRALIAVVEALLAEENDPAGALDGLELAAAELADLGVAVEAVVALADAVRIAGSLGDEARAETLRGQAHALLGNARAEPLLERLGLG